MENLALAPAQHRKWKYRQGIMEMSKPWLSKETNTQSRNASKCFVLKLLQPRFLPKAFVERIWSIKPKGFNLHNRSAPGETRDTVFRKTVNRATDGTEFPVRKRRALTQRQSEAEYHPRCYPRQRERIKHTCRYRRNTFNTSVHHMLWPQLLTVRTRVNHIQHKFNLNRQLFCHSPWR